MKKFLFLLLLTALIFGGAAYATWVLFIKRQQEMKMQGQLPPLPPPPDPSLADFQKCLTMQDSAQPMQLRDAWRDFVERNPRSSKLAEAKDHLGAVNVALFLSPVQTPDKTMYVVQRGDVIMRVATRTKSTPEMIMKMNGLTPSNAHILRIGQRLMTAPADFSLQIDRGAGEVVLLQEGKFFKQYPILVLPVHAHAGAEKRGPAATPKPPKVLAKVSEKIAWSHGTRVIFTDKDYPDAEHWIVVSPSGYSLYTESPAVEGQPPLQKPPGGGYGLAPDAMQELAAVLRKNDPVTID